MRAGHFFGRIRAESDAGDVGFMLSNRNGSYAFFRDAPKSRYEGLFLFEDFKSYKLIEDINIPRFNKIKKIKNYFYFVERERGSGKESLNERFFMPRNFNSLIYELNAKNEIELFLDCKDSYDNREFGRHYDVFAEDGCIVIKFTKRTDLKEDSSSGIEQYALYLAIKTDDLSYKKSENWIERHYENDKKRSSKPYSRYAYHAVDIEAKQFVFSMSKSKKDALKEANYIFNNLEKIKNDEKNDFEERFLKNRHVEKIANSKKILNNVKIAYIAALNSLYSLMINNGKNGILAGLPWFFQVWSRDQAVSLKALRNIDNNFSKKLLVGMLEDIQDNGRIQNILYSNDKSTNADSVGWLFKRASEYHEHIKRNMAILRELKTHVSNIKSQNIRAKKTAEIISSLERKIYGKEKENNSLHHKKISSLMESIDRIIKTNMRDGLIYNDKKETWMDTDSSSRQGFNIEIQAFSLAMLKYAYDVTNEKRYKILENVLKAKTIEKFWQNGILVDNLSDKAIRPNVFIAHYAYPELLSEDEWEKCFDILLKKLFIECGGVSTIDQSSQLFVKNHTGEEPKSYHNGDSWFWLNNLAALSLFRINKKKFNKEINKIINASAKDILWQGVIGAHSELSSAEKLQAEGCLNQAWSNAMFIELIDEICH